MTIRQTIQARADELGLKGYGIAHEARKQNNGKWAVSVNHVNQYLNGQKDMTSEKVDAVLRVLGLVVKQK